MWEVMIAVLPPGTERLTFRRFDAADLQLAQELARRAALAVENARLYRRASETAATLDTLVATAPIGREPASPISAWLGAALYQR